MQSDKILKPLMVKNVSKSFAGVQALRDVSLEVLAGQVHALVGENGAGKSTLIKIITGAHAPDSGMVEIAGQRVTHFHPTVSQQLGVAVVYQQPTLFPDLSVAENLAYGLQRQSAWRPINWRARRMKAKELLQRVGAQIDPRVLARDLSMPQQQLVEIARAVGTQARLIIMDEPSASLSTLEVEHLMRVIRILQASGTGILYVSHRLEELAQIAQQVTVLRDGAWVTSRPIEELSQSDLVRQMVGREVSQVFPQSIRSKGSTRLAVNKLTCQAAGITDISFSVRAGEILGIGGLMGAGRTELARVLFGLEKADTGEIRLDDQLIELDRPATAIAHGIAYVPEDRRQHGVIPEMSVAENVTMGLLDTEPSRRPQLNFSGEATMAKEAVARMRIKTASIESAVETLSGGNQQKVALGRWLATKPRILILDEPTQGIDIGAKAEIHLLMNELVAQGLAIILISSEILELLGMCDRIAVMRQGRISGTLERTEATAETIMQLALPTKMAMQLTSPNASTETQRAD